MFSQLRMREEQALLAQDYALEQAEEKGLERGRAEGIEQGLERGKVEGRKGRRETFCISGYGAPTCFNFRICK